MERRAQLLSSKTLARIYAGIRRQAGVQLAKYVLCPFGLASDTVGDVTVDQHIALMQSHPDSEICLCPVAGKRQPKEAMAWYYADCIAYDHDIPVIVLPTGGDFERFAYRYALSPGSSNAEHQWHGRDDSSLRIKGTAYVVSRRDTVKEYYIQQLCTILGEVREIRQGPLTYIVFRYGRPGARTDLAYSTDYAKASQDIHLYAVALRQADTLSEFLCYYRVIESVTNSNGVTWVTTAINRLGSHDFGRIEIGYELALVPRTRNLLAIWRRRAFQRLSTLRRRHSSAEEIAKYLYKINRCGIAHGQKILRGDITPSYFEVVRDTYVLKLLARLAIDEKVR
jgi:hypothetical protein